MSSDDVKRIIAHSLEGAGLPAPFAKLLDVPLRQPGRALSDDIPSRWENFIRSCAEAAEGDVGLVPIIAASYELTIAALDVLDEIEDGDHSELVDQVGTARALNISTALMAASQNLVLTMPVTASTGNSPSDFGRVLSRAVLCATAGQDQDLQGTTASDGGSLYRSLAIAQEKSGSLVAGAAVLGAMTGCCDEMDLARYWDLGIHFGAMAQIANDIHDALDPERKSDLAAKKPTLPMLFASRASGRAPTSQADIRIEDSGALHFGWVVLEVERRKCREIVDELGQRHHRVASLVSMIGNSGS